MGFILIGIIIGLVIFAISSKCESEETKSILLKTAIFVLFVGTIFGLFAPTKYGTKEQVETVDLIALSDEPTMTGKKRLIFIKIDENNVYTYNVKTESEFADEKSEAYVANTISGKGNVTIIEQENCTNPQLVTFCEKPKSIFWSSAFSRAKYYYVFYVPNNTVTHNVELE